MVLRSVKTLQNGQTLISNWLGVMESKRSLFSLKEEKIGFSFRTRTEENKKEKISRDHTTGPAEWKASSPPPTTASARWGKVMRSLHSTPPHSTLYTHNNDNNNNNRRSLKCNKKWSTNSSSSFFPFKDSVRWAAASQLILCVCVCLPQWSLASFFFYPLDAGVADGDRVQYSTNTAPYS